MRCLALLSQCFIVKNFQTSSNNIGNITPFISPLNEIANVNGVHHGFTEQVVTIHLVSNNGIGVKRDRYRQFRTPRERQSFDGQIGKHRCIPTFPPLSVCARQTHIHQPYTILAASKSESGLSVLLYLCYPHRFDICEALLGEMSKLSACIFVVLCAASVAFAGERLSRNSAPKVSSVYYWPNNVSYTLCFECGYDPKAAAWGTWFSCPRSLLI